MSAFGEGRRTRPVIVSTGSTTIGRHPGRTPSELGSEALKRALALISLDARELEGLFLVPHGYARAQAPIEDRRTQLLVQLAHAPAAFAVELQRERERRADWFLRSHCDWSDGRTSASVRYPCAECSRR